MTLTAVIDPITPTITVELFGVAFPEIFMEHPDVPVTDISGHQSDWTLACPLWGGGVNNKHWAYLQRVESNQSSLLFSNYPTFQAAAYSTGGLLDDFIGVKVYSIGAGLNSVFEGGVIESSSDLVQPTNEVPFSPFMTYGTMSVFPTLASTLDAPEAGVLMEDASDGWGIWKLSPNHSPEMVGCWSSATGSPVRAYGRGRTACGVIPDVDTSTYYILKNSSTSLPAGASDNLVLITTQEGVYPIVGAGATTTEVLNFSHADLPTGAINIARYWDEPDSATDTYIAISCHPTELGWLFSYKKKILGVWTPKYILVKKDWSTFQWVEFTAGDALAQDVLDQSELDPAPVADDINLAACVSVTY